MRVIVLSALLLLLASGSAGFAEEGAAHDHIPGLMKALATGDASARDELLGPLLFELPLRESFSDAQRPDVEDVRALLTSKDVVTRVLGAAASARLGIRAKRLLDDLVKGLGQSVFSYDYFALETLRKLGPEVQSVAPRLAKLLHEQADWSRIAPRKGIEVGKARDVADSSLAALLAIGPAGLAALKDSIGRRSYVRPAVRTTLAYLQNHFHPAPAKPAEPPPAPTPIPGPAEWLKRIEADIETHGTPPHGKRGNDPRTTYWASLEELYALRARAVPALTHAIEKGSREAQRASLGVLAALGKHAKPAGDSIFALVADPESGVRAEATEALGTCGAANPAWLDTLLPLLTAGHFATRIGAIQTIARMGPTASTAREALINVIDATLKRMGPAGMVSRAAAHTLEVTLTALGAIGGPVEVVVPPILRAGARGAVWHSFGTPHGGYRGPSWMRGPRGGSVKVRPIAARVLGQLGAPALPLIRDALSGEEIDLRATATLALGHLPWDAVREDATSASRDASPIVRNAAVAVLRGAPGTLPLQLLSKRLADDHQAVRLAAIDALAARGPEAEAAAWHLAQMISAASPHARDAVKALERIRPDVALFHAPTIADAILAGTLHAKNSMWLLKQMGPDAHGETPKLIAALDGMAPPDVKATLSYLSDAAPQDPAYHAALRQLSASELYLVRRQAMGHLAHAMGQTKEVPSDETLKSLARLVTDSDTVVATGAVRALASVSPQVPAAQTTLRTLLTDKREEIRAHAALGVASAVDGDVAAAACLPLLDSKSPQVRSTALQALAQIGDVAEALPKLRTMLREEKAHAVTFRILPAIASTGAEGVQLVGEHLRTLKRGSTEWYRARGALTFGRSHVVPELRKWLRSSDLTTYYAAASMLREMGAPAAPAVPELFELAETGRPQALMVATEALYAVLGPNQRVLELIARCLRGDELMRPSAARLLASIGPAVEGLLPAVSDALPYMSSFWLKDTLSVVEALGSKAAVLAPGLAASLAGAAGYERVMLLRTLGAVAPSSASTRAALTWALDDPTPAVRAIAASELARRLHKTPSAVERAGTLLRDADATVREAVAAALASIGSDARPALPALVRAAETTEGRAMRAVFAALTKLEPGSPLIRPMLLRVARSDDAWRARSALAALGSVPGRDREITALLAEAAKSWDWRIRLGASEGRAARKRD